MKLKKSKKMALVLSLSLGVTVQVCAADPVEIETIVDKSLQTTGNVSAIANGLSAQGGYPEGASFEIIVKALAGTNTTGAADAEAYGIRNSNNVITTGNNQIASIAIGGKGNASTTITVAGSVLAHGIMNNGILTTENNTIEVTATWVENNEHSGNSSTSAFGIQSADTLSTGNNKITATAIGGKAYSSISASSISVISRADVYGISNFSTLNTGNNTIEVTAIGGESERAGSIVASASNSATANGIYNAKNPASIGIMTTEDNTIKVTAIGGKSINNGTTYSTVSATANGIVNENDTLNTGNNTIEATAIGGEGSSTNSASRDYARAYGIMNFKTMTTKNNTIEVTATGGETQQTAKTEVTAFGLQNGSLFSAGNNMITATATGGKASSTVLAEVNAFGFYNYGTLTTENNTIVATATGGEAVHTGNSDVTAVGIFNSAIMDTKENSIRAIAVGGIVEGGIGSAETTAVGIYSTGGGNLTAVGSQSIHTEAIAGKVNGVTEKAYVYALLVENGGTITLDSQGEAVQLTGDIGVDGSGAITISLDNSDSIWRPRFQDTYGSAENGSFGSGSFTMKDGGVLDLAWHSNLGGYNFQASQLNLTGDTIQIGDGATFIINSDLANNAADTITANTTATGIQYVQVAYDPSYLNYESVTGRALVLDFDGANGKGVVSTVETALSTVTFTPTMEGGYLVSLTSTSDPSEGGQTASDSYQQQINILRTQWSTLVQRLGDVRNEKPESHNGAWARTYGGKLKSDGAYGRKSTLKYGGIQAGYDRMRETGSGKYLAGLLVDYIDADSDFRRGDGDTKAFSFGGYLTWVSPKGHYADVVVKATHLDTDYDFTYLSGEKASADFTNWGYTMSLEYGYRYDLKKNHYMEPQAQFLVGHLEGKNYRTSNGVSLHQDGVNLAMGRLGILYGYEFGKGEKKSSAYVRGSVVRDFSGSGALTSSYEGDRMRIDTADNGGTTFEVNMGTSVTLSKNSHLYAELTKSFGGDVKTDWQANLGWRMKW